MRKRGNTAAREGGLRFEDRVQERLSEDFPIYSPEPHVIYWTAKGPRNAFPDGLVLLESRTIIVEVKSQHMPEAWWQLRKHYQPVLEAYRRQPVQVLEIVKSFDLQMPFPESPIRMFDSFSEVLAVPTQDFGVLVWK